MIEVSIFLAAASALFAAEFFRRHRAALAQRGTVQPERHAPLFKNGSCKSSQHVCQHLAAVLEANAIVIERLKGEILVVAGAPWKAEVQPLDRIALDWSFATGLPPKSGNGNPFCSDWLFTPILVGGTVAAILGVTARHGRRRFILDEQPAIRSAISALQRYYRANRSERAATENFGILRAVRQFRTEGP